ncbi:pentapeptide repeat-containing protein [Mycoavidus sp. HKI]|uniref:WD40 repeat domain-containing protein n=1 Tax=Mycoavidus sp. HKI TaxID=2840467 RepID=UPI001CBEC535|nr:WD40 repeat domain-containing protein [Mycoavidus sp. HKI]UAW63517.1 pentapeptide repeat-containing protein [Mycoavidus sp. HKI]
MQPIAANALALLVKAGVQLNNKDFSGIRVPGADLSYGVFDHTQFQGADLRGVKFCMSWLRDANLSGAQMAGVQFGEWSYFEEESSVWSCAYSPDGKRYAVGLYNGKISVYTTLNWEKIQTLEGHTGSVFSVVYSPSGSQLASGSSDKTIRLWDGASGKSVQTLEGHTAGVNSVVYSPSGTQLASGSNDKTVRLWGAAIGRSVQTLEGHTGEIYSVVYSPSGSQLASGSWDNTVRLWDVQTGECRILIEDSGSVASLSWKEISGVDYLGIGGFDNSVRQWELKKEGVDYKAHLSWSTGHSFLTVRGALMEGVEGLSEVNQRLSKQRGAGLA